LLNHGPDDEPAPGRRPASIVPHHGAEVPAFEDQPPVVGAVTAVCRRKRQASARDLIVAVADRDVKTWDEFFLGVGTMRIAKSTSS